MEEIGSEGGRHAVPGIGAGAEPAAHLRREERPYGAAAELSAGAARALEAELRRAVQGEVRFDRGTRAAYSTDGSNYRQVPIGVVLPRSPEDVVAAVAVCRSHGVPVLGRGGGTSLAGQCCNVGVVFDFSKYMHRVLDVDADARRARVEPGCVLDVLRRDAERHHLTFGPDPSTHMNCTLGGMIGNNSCGMHAQMAGRTSDNVERLEILTYDGQRMWVGATPDDEIELIVRAGGRRGAIYAGLRAIRDRWGDEVRRRFPKIPRRVSGYNLDELLPENGFHVARALVGSESTCALVLQAEVRLVPSPPHRVLLVIGYPDVYRAGDHVPEIDAFGPIALEGLDDVLLHDMEVKRVHRSELGLLPEGRGFLMAEFGGSTDDEARGNARRCMDALARRGHPASAMKLVSRAEEMEHLWLVRESGLAATARIPGKPDTWEGWEDSAVPPARLGEYLRRLRALFDKYGYGCALYGHFGQACVHTRIDWDPKTPEGIAKWRSFMGEATDLCVELGGSFSGEHGDGQSRGEFLPKMFGEDLMGAFRAFKRIWDPEWKMNPGKKIDPYRLDENLRLGAGFVEVRPRTSFSFAEDDGSFMRAALRCVGVGKCHRPDGGVMCPSYQATREELHATRGRARLLFEMMNGDPLTEGWRSEAVHEALHLCLACKGCKSDCPMNVDMATYKSEFLSHYYAGRVRPRAAYAMGLVMWWARAAAIAPRTINALGRAPVIGRAAKAAAGIARQRALPPFAPYTFRRWFHARRRRRRGDRRVLLFTDTFNDFFHPETAIAATEVLEAAGYDVEIPPARVCCGRPLYDWGMLGVAKRMLRRDLDVLGPAVVGDGVPMVVLEPSCAAVFRDELPQLLPEDGRVGALAGATRVLSELVRDERDRFDLPHVGRAAVVQPHCHHHAVIGFDAEQEVLEALGVTPRRTIASCCGMAGSFGFEAGDRVVVSQAVAEQALLPALRERSDGELAIADGFSCRTQIAQGVGVRALHLAEVIRLGIAERARAEGRSDAFRPGRPPPLPWRARARRGLPLAAAAALLAGAWAWSRR